MFIAGAMMISDRKLPKLKNGLPMYASIAQMLCLLIATIIMMVGHMYRDGDTYDEGISIIAAALLLTSFILVLLYFILGPSVVAKEMQEQTSED
jgi:cell division protein FtsW (lipid II flippase)